MKFVFIILLIFVLLPNFLGITVQADVDNGFEFGKDSFNFHNIFRNKDISVEKAYKFLESADWTTSFPDWSLRLLANLTVELHKGSLGGCWGMSYTAKYYYENPEIFKTNYPECSDINEVEKDQITPEIIYNQEISQWIIQPYYFNLILFHRGLSNIEEQIPYIQSQLDNNSPEIIIFDVNWSPDISAHAVLAYNYSITDKNMGNDSEIILNVYDPNYPDESQSLNFSLSQTGQYLLQESYITKHYNLTKIAVETYHKPDWDYVLENRGEIIQLILETMEDSLPIQEIYIAAIIIISISVTILITTLIVVLIIIKKTK